jgi:DNA helicase-2/ATP-dependent DNA helicase PcrA
MRDAQVSKRSGGSRMSVSPARGSAPRSVSRRTGAITACGSRRSRRAIDHVEVAEDRGSHGGYGPSRFDSAENLFASGFYETPGWQRAQRNSPQSGAPTARRREPMTIDGTLTASSTAEGSGLAIGDRVFHQKFGYGRVAHIDGNKLTVEFDKAGEKRVVDSFVERA